jgi:hypothetical protein
LGLTRGATTDARSSPANYPRRHIALHLRRAVQIRVSKIEEKLAALADEYEGLYERGGDILAEMLDLQQRLRTFREILLNRGGHT